MFASLLTLCCFLIFLLYESWKHKVSKWKLNKGTAVLAKFNLSAPLHSLEIMTMQLRAYLCLKIISLAPFCSIILAHVWNCTLSGVYGDRRVVYRSSQKTRSIYESFQDCNWKGTSNRCPVLLGPCSTISKVCWQWIFKGWIMRTELPVIILSLEMFPDAHFGNVRVQRKWTSTCINKKVHGNAAGYHV